MKTLSAFLLGLTLFAGCSTQFAYTGRTEYLPFVSVRDQMALDPAQLQHPKWIHVRMGQVTNPSEAPMRVYVRCGLTSFDQLLPPKTTQEFLISKGDGVCDVAMGTKMEFLPKVTP